MYYDQNLIVTRKKDMVSGRKDELICPGEEGNIKLGLQCLRLKHIPKSFPEAQQSCSEDTSGFINPPQGAIQSEILRKVLYFRTVSCRGNFRDLSLTE